ncbi:MAG: alpha amylase C-terminal domain-containing protein [Clostridia bacterium]|nr:alpha amylase C-terminal domain-containing protein [Clostridia bacterium]
MASEAEILSRLDRFHGGTDFRADEYMGAHLRADGVSVRAWFPEAESVSLSVDGGVDGFAVYPMKEDDDRGMWSILLPRRSVSDGARYSFTVLSGGEERVESDPYAFAADIATGSAVMPVAGYGDLHADEGWMEYRKRTVKLSEERGYSIPLNIYRLHPSSWRTRCGRSNADGSASLSYTELGEQLIPYVKQMGYTHVSLMNVLGWRSKGLCYLPEPTYGSPEAFMSMIAALHGARIGVIADWSTADICCARKGEQEPLSGEQRCFLVSNALFWIEKYRLDGLNVTAESLGGESEAFIRELNNEVMKRCPDALIISEGRSVGGARSGLRLNNEWTENALEYVQTDPIFRKYVHGRLTYPITTAFSENHILPLSERFFSEGSASLIERQFGDIGDKFRGMRVLMMYMMAHPGKKLSFMGNEFGQFRCWQPGEPLEWFMTDFENHRKMQLFSAALNDFYLSHDQLWYDDSSWDGFRWVLVDEAERNLIALERRNGSGGRMICVFNFSGADVREYLLTLPNDIPYPDVENGADPADLEWEVVFSSDEYLNSNTVRVSGGRLKVSLPQRSAVYLLPKRGIEAFEK